MYFNFKFHQFYFTKAAVQILTAAFLCFGAFRYIL
jgi:hypothetical protein